MPSSDITIFKPFRECLLEFLYINSKKANKTTISDRSLHLNIQNIE